MLFYCRKPIALISTLAFFLLFTQPGYTDDAPVSNPSDNTTVPSSVGPPASTTSENTTVPPSVGPPASNPSDNTTVPSSVGAPVSNPSSTTTVPSSGAPVGNPAPPPADNSTGQANATQAPPQEKKLHKCVLKKNIVDKCETESKICGELNDENKSLKMFNNSCELKIFNCQNRDFNMKYQMVDMAKCPHN